MARILDILLELPEWNGKLSGWEEHIPFAFLLINTLNPGLFVELGVQYGISYFAFCQAVKKYRLKTKCFGIDTWKGDKHTGNYEESICDDVLRHNTLNYSGFSTLIKCSFDEALSQFQNKSVDLLHIDGLHTYEAVKHDFETWLPKISEKGVVILHDTTVRRDDFGVWKLWDEIKDRYPSYNFEHNYGLGILAAGRNPDKGLINLLKDLKKGPSYAKMFAELGANILSKALQRAH